MSLSFSSVRCVTFDLTGTLYRFARPVGLTYARIAEQLGYSSYINNVDKMNLCFKQSFKDVLVSAPCYRSVNGTEREWWREVVRGCILRFDHLHNQETTSTKLVSPLDSEEKFDRYFRAVYQAYGSSDTFELYDDVHVTLNSLRNRGFILGVATNSPLRTVECTLPLLNLHDKFDFALSCVDAGQMKPHPALFQLSLRHADQCLQSRPSYRPLLPHEILHIGDEVKADYHGAREVGMQALLIDRSSASGVDDVARISCLRDLLALLPS